jgi:gluconate 5-dehydrogenase
MSSSLFSVADQVVLVSGGSRGIGKALAQGFAQHGAQVWISSRDEASLQAAAKEISVGPHPVRWVTCDVTDPAQSQAAVAAIMKEHGRIDTLLNVAGVNIRKPSAAFSEENFDYVMNINLRGAFFMAQAAGREMLQAGRGSVINIDSLNSAGPLKNVAPYAMSKSGINAMTRTMAMEWGPRGVRVNGLAPGFILTDLTRKLWSLPTMQAWNTANCPLGRLGQPEDLIGAAIFLASGASAFMTGQTIYVDGGMIAGRMWPIPEDGGQ